MKSGWQTKTLDQIAENLDNRRVPITKGVRTSGEYPYYGASGIVDYVADYIFDCDTLLISEDGANLLARSTPIAFPASGKYWVNNHAHILKFEYPETQRFVELYLESIPVDGYITGAAQPKLNQKALNSIPIPFPPLTEQRRIVGILDEAFEGIATAKANAEQNLQNARALFTAAFRRLTSEAAEKRWTRTTVAEIALGKKGSIRTGPFGSQLLHSEFVDEGVAVLGIDNAVANEFRWDKRRFITPKKYQQLGRYRVFPGDVVITIMGTCGRCAIVPDDIPLAINTKHLCCITLDKSKCLPGYLHAYFLYHPISQEFLAKQAKGAIMAGLNMGIIQELPVLLPPLDRQRQVVKSLDGLKAETQRLASLYQRKLAALDELKKSLLHQAFTGQLASSESIVVPLSATILFPTKIAGLSPTTLHAGVLAMAYDLHTKKGHVKYFGHVKAEKTAHMIEAYLGIDLERNSIKDAAGPNDFQRLKNVVEHHARKKKYFDFQKEKTGRHTLVKLAHFDELIDTTRAKLQDRLPEVDELLELMLPMDKQNAELFCTVFAGWNNLLLDGLQPTDEEIVYESRENWHPDKLKIERVKFFAMIEWLRRKEVVPQGRGKKVLAKIK